MKNRTEIDHGFPKERTAVAYMRYSSNNQDENSIHYQRTHILAYASTHHMEVCDEYVDEACTGTHDRRDGFQRMIADAKKNPPWSKILIYDWSRFARNSIDTGRYTAELADLDIEIISVTQSFDDSPEGFLMKGLISQINEYYSRNLAKHAHAGMKQVASQGFHCGGVPPLGYDVDATNVKAKHLVINPREAECVQRIFEMYGMNYSYAQMAKDLNARGYRTKTGNLFNKNSFSSILHQEKYCGNYIWNKARKKNSHGRRNSHKSKPLSEQVRIEGAVPVIISREQFDRVQEKMSQRKDGKASTQHTNHYVLGGLGIVKCKARGSHMIGTTRKSRGYVYSYYYCPQHKNHMRPTKEVRADALEEFVWRYIVKDIYHRKDMVDIFNAVGHESELQTLEEHLAGLERGTNHILRSLRTATTLVPNMAEELKRIDAEKRTVQTRLTALRENQWTLSEDNKKSVVKQLLTYMATAEDLEIKKYIGTVVTHILVSNEDVELELNVA